MCWIPCRSLFKFWALFALVSPLAAAPVRDDGALWRPRFATPALVALESAAHRTFTAEVSAPAGARRWSVVVSNDLRAWSCPVVSATYATINRGTQKGWQVRAQVPADCSPELFTVVVASSKSLSVQPQAVSVTPSFAADFYILHITDEQIVNTVHTAPSGQWYNSVGTWEELRWMQEPVNLINPRLVMVTGDQIDYNGALDGWNNWANWGYQPNGKRNFSKEETLQLQRSLIALYKDCHRGYRVPYVAAPGNHDVPPLDKPLAGSDPKLLWHPLAVPLYEREFGQRSFSLRMGDFYVLMHDWSEPELQTWARADYQQALTDPALTYRLIGQHYTNEHAVYPARCDLMLVGHGHGAATLQAAPYFVYMDGPAFRYGTAGFFNFKRQPHGWACEQTARARDTAKDVWPLFIADGKAKKVRTDQSDAMNVSAEAVTITNDLPQNFYDGRVRFVRPQGTYTAKNGTILAQYDFAQGTRTAVVVRVNIPARDSITVTLAAN